MKRLALLLLAGLAACSQSEATSAKPAVSATTGNVVQDRFRIYESQIDHGGTLTALFNALDRRDLIVFAVIDHAAGAQSAGMSLEPSTLVIFGSPKSGTPLIQIEPLLGIELPMRALVYDRDGTTFLAVTGMSFLKREYALGDNTAIADQAASALDSIAKESTRL
ncbi:DUF302 domain-containing protein [Parvularcula sp. LCG005]|uniref:DUF302 domain-containing protein n=1 Tax=Parvularcula sp. LCG005 TaxID=3078805 RepID=UPI0029427271|nr:DUF302 domain-containing protein [Parvularcula sp. LCG005]WOI54191.1 DUF302 domain-containing protein [Parvularcula sp. LCG005]